MDKQNVSDAEVSIKSEISPVWIVPIIAVLVGCWVLGVGCCFSTSIIVARR